VTEVLGFDEKLFVEEERKVEFVGKLRFFYKRGSEEVT